MRHVVTVATSAHTWLTGVEQQLPFALALALNRTAEEFQAAERTHLSSTFLIRRPWVLQGVKIENADRATKDRPVVTVKIDPTRGFLSKFEAGGPKTSRRGGGSLALPETAGSGAGFTKTQVIPTAQRPRALLGTLGVRSQGQRKQRASSWRKQVFVVDTARGRLILRRSGTGVQRLFFLTKTPARIKPMLNFFSTGQRVVNERFMPNLRGFLAYALRTAR